MTADQLLRDVVQLAVFLLLVRMNGADPFGLKAAGKLTKRSQNPRI